MEFPSWLVAALTIGIVGVAACAPRNDGPNNGVDDVKVACEIRAAWTNAGRDTCINCMASAPAPPCDCELFKEYAGKCQSQNEARLAEPSCTTQVKDCAQNCPKTDCGCLDACYAAAAKCKGVTAATDGCVTDVCAPHCQ